MGNEDDFVMRLNNKLGIDFMRNILARLRNVILTAPDLNNYRSDAEQLYESFSNMSLLRM